MVRDEIGVGIIIIGTVLNCLVADEGDFAIFSERFTSSYSL